MAGDANALAGAEARGVERAPLTTAAPIEEEMRVDVDERTGTGKRYAQRHQLCVSSTSCTSAVLAACSMSISVCSSCAIAG